MADTPANTAASTVESTGYDPRNPVPYTPPPPITAPEITAPPPNPVAVETPSGGGRAPVFGGGKMGAAGSIAYLGDAILRGAMRGREYAHQVQIVKAKKLMDGFVYAKQQADAQLIDMAQRPEVQSALQKRQKLISSKNPEDTSVLTDGDKKILAEYDRALNASNAAWQSINQIQSQYLFGGQGKSKGKGKGGKSTQADTDDPATMAMSSDPATKLRGIFLLRQRLGNPVQYQIRDLLSKVEQQRPALEHQQTLEKLQARFDSLNAIPDASLSPEQRTEKADVLRQIEAQKEVAAPYGKNLDKKIHTFTGADGKDHIIWQRPDSSTYETLSTGEVRAPASQFAKPGTFAEFEAEVAKENGMTAKDLSANSILQLQRAFSDAHKTGSIQQGHYIYKDDTPGSATYGKIIDVPITRRTEAPAVSVPPVSAAPTTSPATTATPSGTAPAATPVPSAPSSTAGGDTGKVRKLSANTSRLLDRPPGSPPGTRVIGEFETSDEKKIHSALVQTSEKARILSALLSTNESYVNSVHADHDKATPRQDLALIVAAVRSMNPGTVRLPQKELEMEIKAGSWGDRFRRQFDIAVSGTLPDDQRDDLFSIVRNETSTFGKSVAEDWRTNFPERPVPNHLKRYLPDSGGAPKVVTMEDIQAYATAKGISIEESKKHATDAGYSIR